MHSSLFVNVISVTQACWCEQVLCTMPNISFISLSELTFHWSGIAETLFWIMFQGVISKNVLFMDNDSRPHRNVEASNTLKSEGINCMQCLAFSLELNSIEHACDTFCRRVSQIT